MNNYAMTIKFCHWFQTIVIREDNRFPPQPFKCNCRTGPPPLKIGARGLHVSKPEAPCVPFKSSSGRHTRATMCRTTSAERDRYYRVSHADVQGAAREQTTRFDESYFLARGNGRVGVPEGCRVILLDDMPR